MLTPPFTGHPSEGRDLYWEREPAIIRVTRWHETAPGAWTEATFDVQGHPLTEVLDWVREQELADAPVTWQVQIIVDSPQSRGGVTVYGRDPVPWGP